MDPGENAAEAWAREVLEETGLVVRVGGLVGIYPTPNFIADAFAGQKAAFVRQPG
jgi:8-oxo-dGTP pyrophosphatase MutT (NUDIX family)|tara:strand:- start:864 stop:1028 length:165 start_codon:yes stop_codon:yes gene_type:complete